MTVPAGFSPLLALARPWRRHHWAARRTAAVTDRRAYRDGPAPGAPRAPAGLLRQVSDRADKLDPRLGVYLTRFAEAAVSAAEQADRELASEIDRGPLHGIPLGIKDILATKGWTTTAQSLVHDPSWWPDEDAPVVAQRPPSRSRLVYLGNPLRRRKLRRAGHGTTPIRDRRAAG